MLLEPCSEWNTSHLSFAKVALMGALAYEGGRVPEQYVDTSTKGRPVEGNLQRAEHCPASHGVPGKQGGQGQGQGSSYCCRMKTASGGFSGKIQQDFTIKFLQPALKIILHREEAKEPSKKLPTAYFGTVLQVLKQRKPPADKQLDLLPATFIHAKPPVSQATSAPDESLPEKTH